MMPVIKVWLKRIIIIIAVFTAITAAFTAAINFHVVKSTQRYIVSEEDAAQSKRCIVVLGAAVKGGRPSLMLKDRLDKAIEIYNLSDEKCTIVMSGNGGENEVFDNRSDERAGKQGNNRPDEIKVMTEYAIEKGVPKEDIIDDKMGYSTYESMYRMINVFGYDEFTVVTQKYHLSRAMYSAKKLGADVYGVSAENIRYYGQTWRDIREILARVKDFGLSAIKYKI